MKQAAYGVLGDRYAVCALGAAGVCADTAAAHAGAADAVLQAAWMLPCKRLLPGGERLLTGVCNGSSRQRNGITALLTVSGRTSQRHVLGGQRSLAVAAAPGYVRCTDATLVVSYTSFSENCPKAVHTCAPSRLLATACQTWLTCVHNSALKLLQEPQHETMHW